MNTFSKIILTTFILFLVVNEGFAQLTAGFTAEDTSACQTDSIKFTNTSTGDFIWIEWDFNGDGIPDLFGDPTIDTSLVNPTYLYTESGLYSVKLKVNSETESDSLIRIDYISVYANPVSAFILNNTGGCAPFIVEGIDQSIPGDIGIDSLNWMLAGPDSSFFFGDTVNIPIAMPLDYFVYLTVVDSLGCSDTDSMLVPLIKIDPGLKSVYQACNESIFTIINNTTGDNPPFEYEWIFGTGDTIIISDTSDITDPSIMISGIESDSIISNFVTITDTTGCSFTFNFDISITVPLLNFSDTAGILTCDPLFSIDYLFPISSPSTNIDTFIVNFGDGASDGTADSIVAAQGLSHTYTSVGAFDVTYTVIDTNGCLTKEVVDTLVWVQGPEASPVWDAIEPCPMKIQFNVEDTNGVDTVKWFFGDEDSSTVFAPVHTYGEVKTYPVKIWAFGDVDINNGEQHSTDCAIEYSTTVALQEPFVFFTFENGSDSLCKGEDVELKNISINNSLFIIENWIWDFGDQSANLIQPGPEPVNPVMHTYDIGKEQNYTITLTATTVGGCITPKYSSSALYVMPPLDLKPEITNDKGCVPLTVSFDPDTSGLIDQISNPFWNFGDGSTSNSLFAQHIYNEDGNTYTVTFKYDAGKCPFVYQGISVVSYPNPVAALTYSPVTQRNSIVSFGIVNQSSGATRVEWWLDGVFFSSDNKVNIPVGETYQLLILKAFSDKECVDETELDLKGILVNPINIITPNGDTYNDVLKFEIPEKEACLKLTIYDRWGRMVYDDNSYADDWGGVNKNGENLKEGTYFYRLDVCGDFVVTGYITIVR